MPSIDKKFLSLLQDDYTKYKTFIETGTLTADTTFEMEPHFEKLFTVEIKKEFYERARSRYKGKKIEFLLGDSSNVFNHILPTINTDAIFFLDGHYSSGNTGKGSKDCPLIEELSIINKSFVKSGIIIIDDRRLFGKGPTVGNCAEDWLNITEAAVLDTIRDRITNTY